MMKYVHYSNMASAHLTAIREDASVWFSCWLHMRHLGEIVVRDFTEELRTQLSINCGCYQFQIVWKKKKKSSSYCFLTSSSMFSPVVTADFWSRDWCAAKKVFPQCTFAKYMFWCVWKTTSLHKNLFLFVSKNFYFLY